MHKSRRRLRQRRLRARITDGRFRADLFYRLSVLRLPLPALRQRPGDVTTLAEWCLKNALAALDARPHPNLHAELGTCAMLLCSYHWPGNVRELRNLMQRAALFLANEPLQALSPNFLLGIAPELGRAESTVPTSASSWQTIETTQQVLTRFDGNHTAAAAHLGISRTTLWRRLRNP